MYTRNRNYQLEEQLLRPPLEDEELGDLSAPPGLDEGVRDISLVPDLDTFFSHLHEYHREQGLFPYLSSRICNLIALAFTVGCSGVLLLGVNWAALHAPCVKERTCDLSEVIFHRQPLSQGSLAWRAGVLLYLALFSLYWAWGLATFVFEALEMAKVRVFLRDKVGVTDTEITSLSFPEVLERVLALQATTRLTITGATHLTELDALARILRKDHFLMGLLNSGALSLAVPDLLAPPPLPPSAPFVPSPHAPLPPAAEGPTGFSPFARSSSTIDRKASALPPPSDRRGPPSDSECSTSGHLPTPPSAALSSPSSSVLHHSPASLPPSAHFLFTHTLEWNLRWVLLDWMFGPKHRLKPASLLNAWTIRRRLRLAALLNLAVSPFLAVFLCIFYFLRNAESFYHHPSTAGSRRWSPLAHWQLREWNELEPQLEGRIDPALPAAEKYVAQFRPRSVVYGARLISFLAGSFAALILALALVDDDLLERPLYGRNLVWWGAGFGVVLAVARGLADEETRAYDPEGCLGQMGALTRHLPSHWKGRAHKEGVYREVVAMVPPRPLLFLQELLSVATNPVLLGLLLPRQTDRIVAYLQGNSRRVEGLGDVVSASLMNLGGAHSKANGRQGTGEPSSRGPVFPEDLGKIERSLLSFCLQYPSYRPGPEALAVLRAAGAAWVPGKGVVPEGGAAPGPAVAAVREGRSASFTSLRFVEPSNSLILTGPVKAASASSSLLVGSALGREGLPPGENGVVSAAPGPATVLVGGELTPGQLQRALLSQSLHRSLQQSHRGDVSNRNLSLRPPATSS